MSVGIAHTTWIDGHADGHAEDGRGARVQHASEIRSNALLSLSPALSRNTRVATASIRQESTAFGMRRGASRFSLRSLCRRILPSPFRFTSAFPATCVPPPYTRTSLLSLSLSLSRLRSFFISVAFSYPLCSSPMAVPDTKGRQKAIGANGLVARTRRPFD